MKLTRVGVVDPVVRWFDLRGCNSLLRGTSKYRNTSVRAFPALIALFLLVMLVLVPLATPAGIALGLVISVVVLIAAWLLGRLVRRGEPLTVMGRVRWTEVVAFIVGPMIAVAIPSYGQANAGDLFGGVGLKPLAVLAAGALQIILISAVLLITGLGLGLGSLSRWLLTEFLQSIRLTGTALAASLPVILGVVFFFFMNPGVWLIIGRLPAIAYTAAILLLLLLTGAFLGSRSQFDLRTLSTFDNTEDLRAAPTETPMQDADVPAIDQPERTPLGRRQRINLRLLAILSSLLVIALAVFSFFLVLGYITIDAEAIKGWTKQDPWVITSYAGAGRTSILSWEHVKVAGFLATFAAMNFSLASATDARLGQATNDRSSMLVRQACAMRLALLRRGA